MACHSIYMNILYVFIRIYTYINHRRTATHHTNNGTATLVDLIDTMVYYGYLWFLCHHKRVNAQLQSQCAAVMVDALHLTDTVSLLNQ